MAAIGRAWEDGAWIEAGWQAGAWSTTQAQTAQSAALLGFLDLDPFMALGALASADLAVWWDLEMGFAESVLHGGTEIVGIFDDQSGESAPDGPMVRLKTSDVTGRSIARGDPLTIRSRTFEVRALREDGTGSTMVVLQEL